MPKHVKAKIDVLHRECADTFFLQKSEHYQNHTLLYITKWNLKSMNSLSCNWKWCFTINGQFTFFWWTTFANLKSIRINNGAKILLKAFCEQQTDCLFNKLDIKKFLKWHMKSKNRATWNKNCTNLITFCSRPCLPDKRDFSFC